MTSGACIWLVTIFVVLCHVHRPLVVIYFILPCAAYVVQRIDEAVKEYSRQFDTLMHMLKEQVQKTYELHNS